MMLRVTQLYGFITAAKDNITEIVDKLKVSPPSTPTTIPTSKKPLIATGKRDKFRNIIDSAHKDLAICIFENIHRELTSFATFLEEPQPVLLFSNQDEIKETIVYLCNMSEKIIDYRQESKMDPRGHQWILEVVQFLLDDIDFLSQTNIEICMLNKKDLKEFDELIASKPQFSDVVKGFQQDLHVFFRFINTLTKRERALQSFRYDYVGQILQKYQEKIKRWRYFNALHNLKQTIQEHRQQLQEVNEPKRISRFSASIIETSRQCYVTLNGLRELANIEHDDNGAYLNQQAETAIGNMREHLFNFQKTAGQLVNVIDKKFAAANSCNQNVQNALTTHFDQKHMKLVKRHK